MWDCAFLALIANRSQQRTAWHRWSHLSVASGSALESLCTSSCEMRVFSLTLYLIYLLLFWYSSSCANLNKFAVMCTIAQCKVYIFDPYVISAVYKNYSDFFHLFILFYSHWHAWLEQNRAVNFTDSADSSLFTFYFKRFILIANYTIAVGTSFRVQHNRKQNASVPHQSRFSSPSVTEWQPFIPDLLINQNSTLWDMTYVLIIFFQIHVGLH